MTSETTSRIAADYLAGDSFHDLQRRYHCQTWQVSAALREHGVTSRPRGGNTIHHRLARIAQRQVSGGHRPGRAVRIMCDEQGRECVMHDLPGECDACRAAGRYAMVGIVSTLEVEGMVR